MGTWIRNVARGKGTGRCIPVWEGRRRPKTTVPRTIKVRKKGGVKGQAG